MLKINIVNDLVLEKNKDVLVLGLFKENMNEYKNYNVVLDSEIKSSFNEKRFKNDFNEVLSVTLSNSLYKRVLVIGLGEQKKFDEEKLRRVLSKSLQTVKALKFENAVTNISGMASRSGLKDDIIGRCSAEALVLSSYVFDKYSSKAKEKIKVKDFSLLFKKSSLFEKGLMQGKSLGENTNYVRDLVNEPASVVNTVYIEREAKKIALESKGKIKLKILDSVQLAKLGLNALLSVGQGSKNKTSLIFLDYNPGKKNVDVAIVGKGVTFDSGGYNLKPTGYIEEMKCDMSGAGAILGTMKTISTLKSNKRILGVIPVCENMVSSNAFRPGDIIKTYNGKTIEVSNTDAEGRLILADAISFTEKNYKPRVIIDIATLTGSVVIALGYYFSALISNNDSLKKDLINAGNLSYDRVWELPFDEDYYDLMDGEISDLTNVSKRMDRAAGTITAGVFLSKFLENSAWAHIDIAGTAYLKEAKNYNYKHGSGAGVRLLSYYLLEL